jgi:hypothetical protein
MADPTKRRAEILKEIIELGRLQKVAIQDAKLREGNPLWDPAYDERARRIAQLVSELVDLDETGGSKIA